MPIQQCRVCAHLQQEAHHARLPGDHRQVQWCLVQVIGEVDNTQVPGMVDDVGYLLDDTGLPMDDGQVNCLESETSPPRLRFSCRNTVTGRSIFIL